MVTRENRRAPLDMSPEEFRRLGHHLIDQIGDFLESLPSRPVTTGEPPSVIQKHLGQTSLPANGCDAGELLDQTARLLFDHSLFNGHPRFLGYITSSAAPLGALADLLAATVNPNVGAWLLSPVATEIENQATRWIAELIGYDQDCGGLLVSGGNMANFVGFLTARHAKSGWDARKLGLADTSAKQLRVYVSGEAHTWVYKAADMCGLGTDAIRWIDLDEELRMDCDILRQQIKQDLADGDRPFMVVGTGGSVGTGVVDPLEEIASICREFDLWFHVDGAYGAFAAALPDAPEALHHLGLADSVALDPHKWLYAPLEAGCALVRDAKAMQETFSYHPLYYKFDDVAGEPIVSLVDFGPQNSRGFRALKVWLALKQVGRSGYTQMIAEDIELAQRLFAKAQDHAELEPISQHLSISCFRYVPIDLDTDRARRHEYLNKLNEELLTRMQEGGEAFVSNTVVRDCYLLRACVVNFRTTATDIDFIIDLVVRLGREVDREMRAT